MLSFEFNVMAREILVQDGIVYRFAWCERCGNHSEQHKTDDGWQCTCGHTNKE